MRRRDWFFRQKVTESELDAAFNDVEAAFKEFVQGFNYVGIALGAEVTQAAVPNLTVDVSGPAIIYDQVQEKIGWTTAQSVNMALDENGAPTTTGIGGGNEKWLSLFAEFKRVPQDPRVDGTGATVYHVQAESYNLNVVQGAPAPIGTAVRPGLRADQILLADIRIEDGVIAILNADIDTPPSSTSRAQLIYNLPGSPLFIQERNLQDAVQSMLDTLNAFDAGTIPVAALASAGPEVTDPPDIPGGGSIEDAFQRVLNFLDNRGRLSAANTWAAEQTVNPGVLTTPLLRTTDFPTASKYNLVFELPTGAAGSPVARLYVTADGHYALTLNAAADTSGPPTWTADNVSRIAVKFEFQATSTITKFEYLQRDSTAAPWTTWVGGQASKQAELRVPSGTFIQLDSGVPASNERFIQVPLHAGIATPITAATAHSWVPVTDAGTIFAWESTAVVGSMSIPLNHRLGSLTEILSVDILADMPSGTGAIQLADTVITWITGTPVLSTRSAAVAVGTIPGVYTVTPTVPWFVGNNNSTMVLTVAAGGAGDKLRGVRIKVRETIYGNNW